MIEDNAKVRDSGPGSFIAHIETGGLKFDGDEPVDLGGTGTGPGPYDLLCAALAECSALTVRLYADRKAWPLTGVEVGVRHEKTPDESPPDLFHRRIRLEGPLDDEQRARLMDIAERCPVHRTLTAGSRIETKAAE